MCEVKKYKKNISVKSLALSLLARRELTRSQLQKKLSLYFFGDDLVIKKIQKTLDELENKGYLDDQRYTDIALLSWTKKYGNLRIISQLKKQGISQKIVKQTIEKIKVTEFDRAVEVWEKKFTPNSNFFLMEKLKKKHKDDEKIKLEVYKYQVNFLARRGFSIDVINKILKKVDYFTNEI